MAKSNIRLVPPAVNPPAKKKAMTGAERQARFIKRLKERANTPASDAVVTPAVTLPTSSWRHEIPALLLLTAALGLAMVGLTMNAYYARSLGSTDIAGWLFLVLGVASDLVALGLPHHAAGLWQARRRAVALMGWAAWFASFLFAINAGIGFASVNIADTTSARAARVTPAVQAARAALDDATAARDRECKGGVGKFCREREATVNERQAALAAAQASVAAEADPQTMAAMQMVTWLSGGVLRPRTEDFAMLRLVLLAILPQIGGILLMVGRAK